MDPMIVRDVVWGAGAFWGMGLFWILLGYPYWRVWASHQAGLADLQKAKNEQQIQIAKAQSRLDAAELNKKAAIIEAQAVADQIKAIGGELTHHDLYLRWQWIKMMEERPEEGDHSVIYVPTEANIPILEASRLRGKEAKPEEDGPKE
jgi:regulator of protease activity HflC (stomatin/prohibitin superfamily)